MLTTSEIAQAVLEDEFLRGELMDYERKKLAEVVSGEAVRRTHLSVRWGEYNSTITLYYSNTRYAETRRERLEIETFMTLHSVSKAEKFAELLAAVVALAKRLEEK